MPAEQKEIYYLIGDSPEQLRRSPYLEACRAKGYDVLLLSDPIDEFAIPNLHTYKDKPLQAADRGELKTSDADIPADVKEKFAGLLADLKAKLPEVGDVRLSQRLTESAACLVADGAAMTAHMERLLERIGKGREGAKRVLELNPTNPGVVGVGLLHARTAADPRVELYGRLLYEQAVIAEGSKVPDPAAFAKRINDLVARDAKG